MYIIAINFMKKSYLPVLTERLKVYWSRDGNAENFYTLGVVANWCTVLRNVHFRALAVESDVIQQNQKSHRGPLVFLFELYSIECSVFFKW